MEVPEDDKTARRELIFRPALGRYVSAMVDAARHPVKLTKAGKPAKKQPVRSVRAAHNAMLLRTVSDIALIALTPNVQRYYREHSVSPRPDASIDPNGKHDG